MKKIKTAIMPLVVLLTASLAPARASDSVTLEPVNHLRKGVGAWPLIANPSTPPEQHINATLRYLNERMQQSLRDCDQSARDAFKELGSDAPKDQDPTADDWQRTIEVAMTGPRYLSIVARDETSCGGAHPDTDTLALVFDLTTGRPVNWMNLIAKSANASSYSDSITDGTTVGALIVPALRAITVSQAEKDCKDAFEDPQSYQLWPDAKSGTLVAQAFDLPHAVAACADDLALTMDQARKLGFDEPLLTAIDQAHHQLAQSKH